MCEKSIYKSIDIDNVAYMLGTADARQAKELQKRCFDFIMKHFGKVIGTQLTELPKHLLRRCSSRLANAVFTCVSKFGVLWRKVHTTLSSLVNNIFLALLYFSHLLSRATDA